MRVTNGLWRLCICMVAIAIVSTKAIAAGDFNEDGVVNDADLRILLEQVELGEHNPTYDVNGDGLVNSDDLQELIPSSNNSGDFNFDSVVGIADVDLLNDAVASGEYDPLFDIDEDGLLNVDDIVQWANFKANTWIGDANMDGEFDSSDFVVVF